MKSFLINLFYFATRINSKRVEIKKIKNKKRKKIYSSIKLDKSNVDEIEKIYKDNYGKKIPLEWHKYYSAYTNNLDKYYFPELLYIPEFEKFMNYDTNLANVLENKNVLYNFFSDLQIKFPEKILSCEYGIFKNSDNEIIEKSSIILYLNNIGECFYKPSIDTCSGDGCLIYNFSNGKDILSGKIIEEIINDFSDNFVIQKIVKCHDSISKIYDKSVNTFRIMTYRWKDKVYAAPAIMRIGKDGSFLDNAHAGGIFIAINNDGSLGKKAFTEFNDCFEFHPDSNIKFENYKIDLFPKVLETSIKMHYSIPNIGVVNWDLTLDEDGNVVLIEANINGGGIWVFQMAHGKSPFGELTPEILRWMKFMKKIKYEDRKNYLFGKIR